MTEAPCAWTICANYIFDTCFPSENVEFWYVLGRRCLCDWPRINTLNAESILTFLDRQHFACCHNSLQEELSTSCVPPVGDNPWKLAPGFLWTLHHVPFLCSVYFAVLNHSVKWLCYDMTICRVLLANHQNWGWFWRLWHRGNLVNSKTNKNKIKLPKN